ncbi:MAG: FkbM family methyltransferase [Thermoleophilaceae bacterium]
MRLSLPVDANCVDVGANAGEVLDEIVDIAPAGGLHAVPIKIDAEGSELAVLRGARRVLGQRHPIVVFEHGAGTPGKTRAIHELLSALGFRLFDVEGNGPLSADELEAVVEAGRVWTFVAHA